MRKTLYSMAVLLLVCGCRQESIGPLNGILVVYSDSVTDFIDSGGMDLLNPVIETVDPERVFSFSYASVDEFQGTLRERRMILMLLAPEDSEEIPSELREDQAGIYSAEDVWAKNQSVFAVISSSGEPLPDQLQDVLLMAYDRQVHSYLYRSFVSTSMTSPERMDSISTLGFTMDVPKSYGTREWMPLDGFIQFQRQPDEECLLLLSISVIPGGMELNPENAMLAREAMARNNFYDAAADSVDRARTTWEPWTQDGLQGIQLTGVWRNPEYLNAGSFTTRVLDGGDEWYILDMEVYNPGHSKEPYLREGWIIMNTFGR